MTAGGMTTGGMSGQIRSSVEVAEEAALDCARGVAKASDDLCGTAETEPLPEPMATQGSKSPAQWAYERLILYIKNFEEQLDEAEEVAMGFVGGDAGVLKIEGIGFFAPDLLTFYGRDETGARTQLVQHVSQLSVLLRAEPKAADMPEPRRIGFRLAEGLGGAKGDTAPPPDVAAKG